MALFAGYSPHAVVLVAGLALLALAIHLARRMRTRRARPGLPARDRGSTPPAKRRRPRRCCGHYIPDCEGCPFFQKLLFDSPRNADMKGRCLYYHRDLTAPRDDKHNRVVLDDGPDATPDS